MTQAQHNYIEPDIQGDASLSSAEKRNQQLNKDIAYTINHAFACTAVDWLGQTPAMVAVQKAFGVRNPGHIGCSNPFHVDGDGHSCAHGHHDHHHDHHHHHHHHHHHGHGHHHHDTMSKAERALHTKHVSTLAKMYTASEVIGDFAGVIPTVMMQRYTPWAMDGIRPLLRFTLGPFFYLGAIRSSRQWANDNGVAVGSDTYKQHLHDIYEHEMHHLPQAAWWTAWSSGLNIALQEPFYERFATPKIRQEFPLGSLSTKITRKIQGASLSIGLVLGTRALFPEAAHRFTNWTEQNLVTPATKIVTRTIGIDSQSVNEAIADKKRYHDGQWQQRSREIASQPEVMQLRS